MATMFASFMMSSVRVVNLTLANDRDREALLEAVSAANSGNYDTTNGPVTIEAIDTKGEKLILSFDVKEEDGSVTTNPLYRSPLTLEGNYVKYTAPNGTKYSIYLGTNAIAVEYLALLNKADSDRLLDAVNSSPVKDAKNLQVTYRGDTKMFEFDVLLTFNGGDDGKGNMLKPSKAEIFNGADGNPHYVKYFDGKKAQTFVIYLYKETTAEGGGTGGGTTNP